MNHFTARSAVAAAAAMAGRKGNTLAVILRRFIEFNQSVCAKIAEHLPQRRTDPYALYDQLAAEYMNAAQNQLVVDVGGGRTCAFTKYKDPEAHPRIVAVDVSADELAANRDADETRVMNAVDGLPFDDEEVDLVASKTLVEHLCDTREFIAHVRRVLKPGGHTIHMFPSRFALFALINRILPAKLSTSILFFLCPGAKRISGFPAYYDKCYYSAFRSVLEERGFEITESAVCYYQSAYFTFFIPLYLLTVGYELLLYCLDVKNLCGYVVVAARKQ